MQTSISASEQRLRSLVRCLLAALVGACTVAGPPHIGASRLAVEQWASAHQFQTLILPGGSFSLLAVIRMRGVSDELVVYIEGDGTPWPSRYRPPRDPTPAAPLALFLAASDPAPAVAWLARPCQYAGDGTDLACDPAWWTEQRYASEIIAAMGEGLDRLKKMSGAARLILVGYSGGGVIATLLAMRRNDVAKLHTVAAPLSLDAWVEASGLSQLDASLDPMKQPGLPATVAAVHMAGEHDTLVPPAVISDFVSRHGGKLSVLSDYDHTCCWVRDWPEILQKFPTTDGRR